MLAKLLALTTLLATPAAAFAQSWSAHAEGEATVGWTDNVFSLEHGDPRREGDLFYMIQPGALLTHHAPRVINSLRYGFHAALYQENTEANAYNHGLDWQMFWLTGPRTEMGLGAGARTGTIGTLQLAAEPGTVSPDVLPGADLTFWDFHGSQIFRWQATRDWRTTQELNARQTRTFENDLEQTRGLDIGGTLGGDLSWKEDGIAFGLGTHFIRLKQFNNNLPNEQTDQLNTTAEVGYRRDVSARTTVDAYLGLAFITPLDVQDDTGTAVRPTARASAHYIPDWGNLSATYERAAVPNLYTAQNTLSDQAVLRYQLPLPWLTDQPREPVLSVSSSAGWLRGRQIDLTNNELAAAWDIYLFDAAVTYSPGHGALGMLLRYQYTRQAGDDELGDGFPDYSRHTIMLSAFGRWPERIAGVIPVRSGIRVDGSDRQPTGDARSGAGEGL